MALLYGRTGRLAPQNGGFQPGQMLGSSPDPAVRAMQVGIAEYAASLNTASGGMPGNWPRAVKSFSRAPVYFIRNVNIKSYFVHS